MKISRSNEFELSNYGNDWGIFIDIENSDYNLQYNERHYRINKKEKIKKNFAAESESENKGVLYVEEKTNYITKVTSTTIITCILTYIVYFIL